ncbi:MAG: UvrD-helicase domain-containing protein [Planctomycetota bacterium]|nr:UvrD-helicase domain-containing protein [Planctomycetota bacterium]
MTMSVSLQLPATAPPFRTSPSAIARYFFLDCQRFLRFHAASPQTRRDEQLPSPEFDHSPLIKAVLESGFVWEQTVVEQHLDKRVFIAPGEGDLHTRRFDWKATLELLRTAPVGTFIYQPTLRLPLAFYERYGIDPQVVVLSDNHPDLIAVRDDGEGRRVLRVMDVKRGESMQLTHRVQVLLYALELEAILWAESLEDPRVDMQQGEVWLGSQLSPTEFDLAELRPHLEKFLRHELTPLLRAPPDAANWHVYHRCEWCDYFDHCRDQMQRDNDVSRISHLTSYGKQFLRHEAHVTTVTELGEFLQTSDADNVLSRCASLAGRGPRLARQVTALETNEPQTHGAASPSLSKGENISLFLTLQKEPLSQAIYLAGLHLTLRRDLRDEVLSAETVQRFYPGNKSQPYVLLAKTPDDTSDIRRQWVRVLHEIIVGVDRFNQDREWRDQLSLQAYVLTEEERGLLVEWLLESLQDVDEPELAEQAMTLLFHFQSPELLVADSHPAREVPFPVVVLLDALGHVMALPVEVSYTLPESLASLGSRFQLNRNDYFHFPLGHGMRAEPIHAAWYRGKGELMEQIKSQTAARLRAARELLQSIRHRGTDAIYAWAAKFALPTQHPYADPLLSRLAFFARYESLLDCLDKRHARCEPLAAQLLLAKVMQLRATSETEFEVTSGTAMPIDAGGFPEWLLVTDNEAGRRAQLEYRDYACRKQLWTGKPQSNLAVVGVCEIQKDKLGTPAKLTVEYAKPFIDGPPQPGQQFLLYPRFTDYSTDSVVEFLQGYGAVRERLGEDELFLRLLRDPQAACQPRPLSDDLYAAAVQQLEHLQLTGSQTRAYFAICNQRVVPVWGPPGTGKTHFLAAAILGLAAVHLAAKKPFRVLVSAYTHAAIENLLRKVTALQSSLGLAGELQVAKVKAWHGDGELSANVIEEKHFAKWLKRQTCAVVGATTYACLKAYEKLPEFDFVVIDEASQVRVPEASVPISLAGSAGRLVLAGDHLQLPPIIKGVYPDPPAGQPVLHRSVFEAFLECDDLSSLSHFGDTDGKPNTREKESGDKSPHSKVQLTENFRMNDVLTSFAAGLLYGHDYLPFNETIAARRLGLSRERCFDPFAEACLDPACPLTIVILDGVWAARENQLEAQLVSKLVIGLRGALRDAEGRLYANDDEFFRRGVFLVSPHRAQIRLIERELRRQRMWQHPPFVDTVDKMQGQEADAVIVSYGVSDPEFAVQEAEFIYGLNRLNVAVTRARSKCVVFLSRALLDAASQIWDRPEATRGLSYMREMVAAASRCGETRSFELEDGATAEVIRVDGCFETIGSGTGFGIAGDESLRQFVDVPDEVRQPFQADQDSLERLSYVDAPEKKMPRNKTTRPKNALTKKSGSIVPATAPAGLANLNEQQRIAATHGSEPLLIIAGAGTGKTTTLVHRVAHLISEGIPAYRILLLTFTRRSATEMLQRVGDVLAQQDVRRNVWGGTFHGVGTRLLRIYGKHIGIDERFTIHDRGDAESLMQSVCQDLELAKDDKKFPRKGTCMSIHSYMVNAQLSLDATLQQQFSSQTKYAAAFAKLFEGYANRKRELNVFDFDDLLVTWCELLEHEQTGPTIRDRFDCVLVDEYQDTNCLQSRLLKRLCPDGRGLTIVGDDAQSIYSFRAANVRNILDFPKQFPGARVIALEQNYRSVAPILAASNSVISQASERYTKDLWSDREEGSPPQLITCFDEHEQVDFIVARIHDHRQRGIPLSQQAVLFRSAQLSILLEAELARQDIAYVKYGGLKFIESAHVKDLMSFLRLAENPRDRVAGQRVLTLLAGVGPKKAMQLQQIVIDAGGDFAAWSATKPPAKAVDEWTQLVSLLQYLSAQADDNLAMQIQSVLTFYEPLMEGRYDNLPQRLSDLEQLKEVVSRFEDRTTMLAELALDPPDGEEALAEDADRDRLILSTMHSAKGLEWKVVYILHASDGKIPHERSMFDPEQLEEERRMFYVAMTRAADWLYVCHPRRQRASQYGGSYFDDYEQVELTRFITKPAKQKFQQQQASSFALPTAAVTSKTPNMKRDRKKKPASKPRS